MAYYVNEAFVVNLRRFECSFERAALHRLVLVQRNSPLHPKTVNCQFQSAAFAAVHGRMAILKKAVGRVKRGARFPTFNLAREYRSMPQKVDARVKQGATYRPFAFARE
jgi:hypothetical protein